MSRWLVCLPLLLTAVVVDARGVYMRVPEFVEQVFPQGEPQMETLWLTPEIKQAAGAILGHDYHGLRVRYWRAGPRTAWVLEEIGKELPITIGVVVESGRIVGVEILAFRESRGGEVRYPFFTDQFRGARLRDDTRLDRRIDNVTGATLSVSAVTRVARLALLLAEHVEGGQ